MDAEVDKEIQDEDFREELEETQEGLSYINTIENEPLEGSTEHTDMC